MKLFYCFLFLIATTTCFSQDVLETSLVTKKELKADDLLGVCIQHEIDHLNGILFIDHLSRIKKEMILNNFRNSEKPVTKQKL